MNHRLFARPLLAVVLVVAGLLAAHGQDRILKEQIRDLAPNKKFALLIKYGPAMDDGSGEDISRDAIRSIDLVALPAKTVLANLVESSSDAPSIEGKIVWSADSNWLAFATSEGHRVTETSVYRWKADKFEPCETDQMSVEPGGDARNQYVTPLRWVKPGTLLLNQFTIFYNGKGDSTIEFTVRFEQAGKFHVINRKKVRTKDE